MAADADGEDTRARVQTYVPTSQRKEWEQRADSMDMSLSEFVRTMTQAGKRGFDEVVENDSRREPSGGQSSTPDPQGSRLEERVLSALSGHEYMDWDALVTAVHEEFEDELGKTIDDLLAEGEIEHRHGKGYALT